ncbi:MAG: DUF1553 domain-containing protein [Rhodothermaceae bacterium]|nr:DUF1553 domain-containing protein [Rhodothermaceae bacterium]
MSCAVFFCSCSTPLPDPVQEAYAVLPDHIDFNFDVKPILSDRCFACHGPDKAAREADLRLDYAATSRQKLESGKRAIVPGSRSRSALLKRILHDDPEERMPPANSRLVLSDREKAILVKWIDQGALYEEHWSFLPPRTPIIAPSKEELHPIDFLVRERLSKESLEPSNEATRETWLRRVSLDLTGLPPSIEEMDAFLIDRSETAYERVVDRLLDSPQFGERMAVDWLDLARYADTHGYQDDGFRFVWPWRDWVVDAFNENLPYDSFLTWQLAGDLLPNATQKQHLATTFLRNHRINSEAGIVDEEYRIEYVADRTNTVGTAIMGLTLQCARCHDHKYDPISQKEYYKLFSYFNNVQELGEIANEGNPGPLLKLTSADTQVSLDSMEAAIRRQEDIVNELLSGSPPPQIRNYDSEQDLLLEVSFELLNDQHLDNTQDVRVTGEPVLVKGIEGNGLQMQHYDVVRLPEETGIERYEPFTISLWVNPPQDTGYIPIWGNPANKNVDFRGYELFLDNGRPVIRLCHALPHNYLEVGASEQIELDAWTHLVVSYDGSSRASGIRLYINGKPVTLDTQWDNLYKSIRQRGIRIGGANERGGFSGGKVDAFAFYKRMLVPSEVQWLFDKSADPVQDSHYQRMRSGPLQKALTELEQLRRKKHEVQDTIPEIMVMEEMEAPRPAYVLTRGVYDAKEEPVSSGTPAIFASLPEDSSGNRLALAEWLTHEQHPLTARVAVNRFWQMLFGQGLVATPGDWGNQGSLPSHPALLDWLAAHFIASDWDVKALLKEIVLTKTYRQSSETSPAHLERDPGNVLLARGPAFRLPAEMIRDQALAASGLLVLKLGGPPVKPYQPDGLWEELAAIKNSISTYEQGHGEDLYRRSLYTFWKRSSPPPSLATFDAPTRELCLVQRQNTSTPLQALVLWNDPQFIEAARVMSERLIVRSLNKSDRINTGFRLLTGRHPTPFEMNTLKTLYTKQENRFEINFSAADSLLSVGEYPENAGLKKEEVAALTTVLQTIMSYDASLIRR